MVDAELKRLLAERIESVRSRIAEAARRSGRKAEAIQLVAVSKFHPLEDLLAAVDCGVDILGESRVQETLSKREAWPEDKKVRWHLIGHLQKNKARKALE
ncbi:MAG: YggS family pyridoxal phosphate-dependent enzyme, partial [Synergistaceae bacterium]|nr:YggS family pyridoxal phosphate-dependent enzyme [Synergistaceae bacterium]